MSIDLKTALIVAVLTFLGGWYACSHQNQFWSWTGGVGEYWQQLINKECHPPPGYACYKPETPAPSPTNGN